MVSAVAILQYASPNQRLLEEAVAQQDFGEGSEGTTRMLKFIYEFGEQHPEIFDRVPRLQVFRNGSRQCRGRWRRSMAHTICFGRRRTRMRATRRLGQGQGHRHGEGHMGAGGLRSQLSQYLEDSRPFSDFPKHPVRPPPTTANRSATTASGTTECSYIKVCCTVAVEDSNL